MPWDKKEEQLLKIGHAVIDKTSDSFLKEAEYGLCATCTKLIVIRSRYDRVTVDCGWYNKPSGFRIRRFDPPVECAGYWYVGWVHLKDLIPLALNIENIGKRQVGFIHEEEEAPEIYVGEDGYIHVRGEEVDGEGD